MIAKTPDANPGPPADPAPSRAANPAATAGPAVRDSRRLAFRPPAWLDRALDVAIIAAKAATIACAIDGFVNADTPRFRGKAIRSRAIGYTAGLFIVPVIWRLLPDRGRYPRGLDLAVALPLLIDAGGNALGLYEAAHLDDVVHFINGAIVSGVAGALFATQTEEPWQAAAAGTGTAITAETLWEIAEYLAMKAGSNRMDLTYDDTIADLAETALGAIVGGLVTMLRMPPERAERRRGWRHAIGGWREAGEPVPITGGRGSVAERVLAGGQ